MEATMSESNEKQAGFLGTYFDRDGVLHLSRWADVVAWVVLTVYVLTWLFPFLLFLGQYSSGLYFDKGATFLNVFGMFAPYFQQPIPGLFYFFGLQAISKGLLIFLDMEDNTRRAARR
jgi:hypothetical protein